QLTLPVSAMYFPLNVTFRFACGSAKSLIHATLGQTVISSLGTLQYLANIVDAATAVNFVGKPRFFSVWSTMRASFSSGLPVAATTVAVFPPVYLPLGYPASLMYFSAIALLPSGCST